MIEWINRNDEMPPSGERVLTYSPAYEARTADQAMRYRVMDALFVRISTDVTHWARLEAPAT